MANDPWATEKMSRSDAQRRYSNLVTYQVRPMVYDRRLNDEQRVGVLKRVVASAHRFRYESGVVAGMGTRDELVDLMRHYVTPDSPAGPDLRDWVKRAFRAFGAAVETED